MTRALPLFRPGLLAAAISLASICTAALADSYQLPAAPLASTLTQIASQAGIVLSIDPALTAGKQSAPVTGDYDALDALHQALQGSGLQLQQNSAGSYSLAPVPQAAVALPDVTVTAAQNVESVWGPAPGYLVSRTAAGSKTDTPLLEAPRSISVATREQMQDRGVHSLDDAVKYMPGIVSSSFGSDTRYDWMRVRGFEPTHFLDGLPLPRGVYGVVGLWPDAARRPAGYAQPSPERRDRP